MITYNDLYEAARKERYSDQLQALPRNFVEQVADYFEDKKELSSKEESLFSDSLMKTKKQSRSLIPPLTLKTSNHRSSPLMKKLLLPLPMNLSSGDS